MKIPIKTNQAGFTLIEFIVTLVIAASAAAMLYAFMGTTLTRSSEPIFRLQKSSNINQVMENIVADYNRLNALNLRHKWQTSIEYRVGNVVLPTTSTGYYYSCMTAGSGGAAPSHTTGTVGNWKAGGVIWKSSGTPVENIVWKTSQAYSDAPASIMIPIYNDGHYYRCTTAHTLTNATATDQGTWRGNKSYELDDLVQPTSYNGYYYRCTQAGTSAATEPTVTAWLTSPVNDNTVRWQAVWAETGTILARSNAAASSNDDVLDDNIYNYLTTFPARYGTGYTVVETKFVKFSTAGAEQDADSNDEKKTLKVTIQDSTTGERLTQLFTIR